MNKLQEEALARQGYIRIAAAAEKLGRPITFLHHAIKGPQGGRNGARLSATSRPPEWIRAGFLYFVYEPALAKLVGPVVAKMVRLRTAEQVGGRKRAPG